MLNDRTVLLQHQALPLAGKIALSVKRIREWYDHWDGDVYVSFSGGKDSTVLCDLVWSVYPDVPAVFSNTGLEYPEIVRFVKKMQAGGKPIVIIRPERTFRDVVINDGFPLVSKKVAGQVSRLRKMERNPSEKNFLTRRLYRTGEKSDGTFNMRSKVPNKWMKLVDDAPFETTNSCCDTLKKKPFAVYEKEHGTKPYTGMMAAEGGQRGKLTKCNAFESERPMSNPMLFWTEDDVWQYVNTKPLEICEIYYDRDHPETGEILPGERRTGCMFCAFGAHLEKGPNRFQRMKKSHPKQWAYCINKLGMGEALSFCGVKYEPED